MNDQRRLLVRQADFIALKIPSLIANYEYLIIAGAFDGIDETDLAHKYFKLATATGDSSEKGVMVRAYARFLFHEGDFDKARQLYSDCLYYFAKTSDRNTSYRFDTYIRWAQMENEWGNLTNEKDLLEKALKEIDLMKNPRRKEQELNRVVSLLKKFSINPETDKSKVDNL